MKQAFHTLAVPTRGPGLYECTAEAVAFVRGEKIADGLLTCFVRHTSASLLIQENADPDVQRGEERFAKQTQWSSGPLRATSAASLGERRGVSAGPIPCGQSRPRGARRCAPLRRSPGRKVHWTFRSSRLTLAGALSVRAPRRAAPARSDAASDRGVNSHLSSPASTSDSECEGRGPRCLNPDGLAAPSPFF